MMHSGSPESGKGHVLDQFADSSKPQRILIATTAYGMGVNCKGLRRVIHFGPSKSFDAYLQESGQCGRDGKQSDTILLYYGINAKVADAKMKKYLESSTCQRQFYLKHFGINNLECPPGHSCCGICANSCQCLGSYCDMDLYLPLVGYSEEEAQERTISDEKDLACKGSTVAIASGHIGEEYYLLKVRVMAARSSKNESTDKWGNTFPPGAEMIHGKFYAAVDVDHGAYNLNKEKEAFVYAATFRNICCDLAIKQVRGEDFFYVSEEQHLDI
ncbi:hypothetical protein ACROYT_G014326 [Oculina patagonica]